MSESKTDDLIECLKKLEARDAATRQSAMVSQKLLNFTYEHLDADTKISILKCSVTSLEKQVELLIKLAHRQQDQIDELIKITRLQPDTTSCDEPSLAKTENRGRPKRPVMVGDLCFDSITAAAKAAGMCVKSAIYRIESDNFPTWRYLDEE